MADEIETVVENAGVSEWQCGLANAINDTFSYANNTLFYALVPDYYRDYAWRYIRVATQWLDGYVSTLHQSGVSGIVSTRIASKLITGLTKQVVGEKLIYKSSGKSDAKETLDFVSKWAEEQNIMKAVYSAIGFSLAIGTSILKMNKTLDNEIWWEAVRFDNCFYKTTFKNEITEAIFTIRSYVDTRPNKQQQFYLVEKRYFSTYEKPEIDKDTYEVLHKVGDKIPMVVYEVHRITGTVQNNLMPRDIKNDTINWEEIPQEIRNSIKKDYGSIMIGEAQTLPFKDLGVYALLNGEIDLSIPTGTNFGESLLVGVQDDLITYELASSYQIRDMYLGKGTVYVPKALSLTDALNPNNILSGIGDTKYELLKGVSPENQQVIVQQFQVRSVEWQQTMENALKRIAVKWGLTVKILASFLSTGANQMTATQIDSEDDISIAFISHTRAYFKNTLNKMLEATLNFYGYADNIVLDFASPSLINKDRLIERNIKLLDAGLIDEEEAIRNIYPDLEEEALQRKIEICKKEREKRQQEGQEQMLNSFGDFTDTEDLKGTTDYGNKEE